MTDITKRLAEALRMQIDDSHSPPCFCAKQPFREDHRRYCIAATEVLADFDRTAAQEANAQGAEDVIEQFLVDHDNPSKNDWKALIDANVQYAIEISEAAHDWRTTKHLTRDDFFPTPAPASGEVTDAMVNRFLSWRLPKPWNPDNGISYTRPNYAHPPADHDWPVGTNLFSADQARQMLEHILQYPAPQPPMDVSTEYYDSLPIVEVGTDTFVHSINEAYRNQVGPYRDIVTIAAELLEAATRARQGEDELSVPHRWRSMVNDALEAIQSTPDSEERRYAERKLRAVIKASRSDDSQAGTVAAQGEAVASSRCWICGVDTPHWHSKPVLFVPKGVIQHNLRTNSAFHIPVSREQTIYYDVPLYLQPVPIPIGAVIPTAAPVPADYPECSGDPKSCPENEGYGCCKPNAVPADEGEKCDYCDGSGFLNILDSDGESVIDRCDAPAHDKGELK